MQTWQAMHIRKPKTVPEAPAGPHAVRRGYPQRADPAVASQFDAR
eukprot:CAMPEP_0204339650 /NCGR_PEP_ID=MMETSP0469-20131031/21972_1 /ASSEMBLY_ACC=CAM_ASM_000384 /TAXON_ID=2969 /ORGANISM="Oxyrrhis marina" /LENGTH=44 /DNA_ID= /DNA_START= /DNA_END= /DNA_ORIENTATION=